METFSDNTEDCHLTYVWNNWEIDRIIEQIEDYFGKKPWYKDMNINTIIT